jgi:hypothetical protein
VNSFPFHEYSMLSHFVCTGIKWKHCIYLFELL